MKTAKGKHNATFDPLEQHATDKQITRLYKDRYNNLWRGPLYCGEDVLFERVPGHFVSQNEPQSSWIEIMREEAYAMHESVEQLNHYLTETQITKHIPLEERARLVAVQAHEGQTRWNAQPYITHPIRVANVFETCSSEKQVAYLHDVVEDTSLTFEDLKRFGFSSDIVDAVDAVTMRKAESYLAFILRCKRNAIGQKVKIADVKDNMRDLDRRKSMRLRWDKYELALWILEN